mmetsp:Transcript_16880/g.23615  ORF Transcript_16880/g.23615 Transcript_16880/m.23615 type:complete len:143 (+) Transcript_16880:176-604(+)
MLKVGTAEIRTLRKVPVRTQRNVAKFFSSPMSSPSNSKSSLRSHSSPRRNPSTSPPVSPPPTPRERSIDSTSEVMVPVLSKYAKGVNPLTYASPLSRQRSSEKEVVNSSIYIEQYKQAIVQRENGHMTDSDYNMIVTLLKRQ